MNGFELHKSQVNFERACERVQEEQTISAENKKLILSFAKMKIAKGVTRIRVVKLLYTVRCLASWLNKPFGQATKDDLIELVGEIETKQYSESTKYDFKIILKLFYKWLAGNDEVYPPEVNWLKPRLRNPKKLPEELLTEKEVCAMAEAADHPRNRAFVSVLYETGCRIGELLSLRVKNVQFDQYGAVLRVTGKTGDRRVRIVSSAPVLTNWIDLYKDSNVPDAPLWPPISTNFRDKGQPAEYRSIYVMLQELAKKANITKRIYPHLFRHSRATVLASKLTEAQMKEYFGWVQASDMASIYVHLSGRDVDNALLQLYSLKERPDEAPKLDIKICVRCKEKNSPVQAFCGRCGNPFDESKLLQGSKNEESLLTAMFKDVEFRELFIRKLGELNLSKEVQLTS